MASSTYDSGPYVGISDEDLQPVSLSDYAKQQWNDARHVSVMSARALNLSEAFDEVNEKIARATGAKDLTNPLQAEAGLFQPVKRPEHAPTPTAIDQQPLDVWKNRVRELQKLHPDALPWDEIIDEPGRKALERMKSVREATSALDDRAGMAPAVQHPSLGVLDNIYSPTEQFVKNMIRRPDLAVTGLGAGFAASMTSPVDAALNLVGAAWGGKSASLAKNMFLNAAANTIGQAPLSGFKQLHYKEAGLPYGWDQWTREVAGAGVAGGLIDISVRGPARAVKAVTGHAEGLGGVFTDAVRPLPLPEQPKPRVDIPDALLERARNDDIEAIKEVAKLTGVDQDPAVKGAIHYAETTGPIDEAIAQRFRELGIDDGEGLRVLADAMRGGEHVRAPEPVAPAAEPRAREAGERLLMDREGELSALIQGLDQRTQQRVVDAVEAGIPRIVNLVQERLNAAKGDPVAAREGLVAGLQQAAEEMGGPERFAAMVDLYSGRGDVRSTALAIRDFPDLVDSNLSTGSDLIQAARAISKLEPEAFALFQAGEASPGVSRVVSDLVPPDQQARVMGDMRKAGIETEADARRVVRDLVKPTRAASDVDTPLSRGSKIEDPAGPEAKAQTDRLMKEHAEAVKEAQAPIKAREKLESQIEDQKGKIAKIEEKAAKAAPKPEERYADPTTGEPLSKGDVDSIVSMWSYVAEQKKARKPETLTAFLMDVGRLQDQSGELTNMLGGKSRHLISGKGMALDDAALKAYEAGFFPERPDISTFLEAVRDDLNGNPRVRDIDFNWLEDFREAQKMEQDLAEFGILKAKSEAEVRDAFRSKPEGEGAGGARGDQAAVGRTEGEGPLYALGEEDLAKLGEAHGKLRDLQAQHVEASRGSPLFSLVLEAAAQQRSRDVRAAVASALRLKSQILPDDVKVEVRTDEMRDPTTGNRLDAMSDTSTGDIALAAYALNPAARLGHDGLHTLVTRGLLSPEEVALLAKAGREAGVFKNEADYREAYKGRAGFDRIIEEEAAAHYLEAIIDRRVVPSIPQNLIQKIQQIIERIRNALNGYGFRTETDVVRAILEGDAAARKSVQAWMRSSDVAAVAVNKEKGKLFAFGGEKAETANLDALARAKDLEASGMDRDNIWKLTGWGRGADRKWRFEIDDSDAGFSVRGSMRRQDGIVGERFEHPDLYEAYPALRALDLFWDPALDPKTQLGGYDQTNGVISIAAKLPSQWTVPVLLHELQHGVQEMERFGSGASMAEMAVSPARVESWLQGWDGDIIVGTYFERDITMSAAKVIDGFDGGNLEQLRNQVLQLIERGDTTLEAASAKIAQQMQTDAYWRNSGEVEARLVETRMDMTPEQRRERPFWYDYDVIEQEQVVKRQGAMYAMQDAATGREMRRELDALGFYSGLLEAAKGLKQAKGTPEQMLKMVMDAAGAGAKNEVAATKLAEFMAGKKRVTKDEIVTYLHENRVQVKEAVYDNATPKGWDVVDETGEPLQSFRNRADAERYIAGHPDGDMFSVEPQAAGTKYSIATLAPDDPTNRETVVHMPSTVPEHVPNTAGYWGNTDGGDTMRNPEFDRQNVVLGHWQEPNVVGNLMTSMARHDGKPVYNLVQIQSDWGQRLRDKGARDEAKIADLQQRIDQAHTDIDAYLMGETLTWLRQNVKHYPERTNPGEVRNVLMQIARDGGVFVKAKDITPDMRAYAEVALADRRFDDLELLQAELRTAEAAVSGHPLVNTTDQWTTTMLRRALRQAVEADADFIAIPHGDTVLSYNPGDTHGMREFYGTRKSDGIVAKNLRKILEKMDKDGAKPTKVEKLETLHGLEGWRGERGVDQPLSRFDESQTGFTLFPLTEKIKRQAGGYGQALFAMSDERRARAEAMGFDTSRVWYRGRSDASPMDPMVRKPGTMYGDETHGGIFFTSSPEVASTYAEAHGRHNMLQRYDEAVQNRGIIDRMLKRQPKLDDDIMRDGNIVPVYLKPGRQAVIDVAALGGNENVNVYARIRRLKAQGYDTVLIKNSEDILGKNVEPVNPYDEIVVLNPRNIRSVNAAFDPTKADSPNLMYAMGEPRIPLHDDMEAIARYDAIKQLAEACR